MSDISYDFFPNIHSLLKILATISVITATAERSFSTLRRLKTYFLNNIEQVRLTELALLNIYRNAINAITIENVINSFVRLPRK